MALAVLIVVLFGAILTGGTALMDGDDVAKFSLYGAAGAAVAVTILGIVLWILGMFIDYDLGQLGF